jgi:acyl-CoA reductase-like NAD-dependent aldehyde dehydrogenase
MKMTHAMIIDGEKVEAAETFGVIDPARAEVFAQCPAARPEHLDAAVNAARRAFSGWRDTPLEERARLLNEIANAVEGDKEALAVLLSTEQGKPRTSAHGEIGAAIHWMRETAKLRPAVEVIRDDEKNRIEVHRKPLGVVGSITPWNHPVLIATWHIMPALMAGNCVVIKPSSYTPLSTLRLVELANAHLPHGVLNSVTGEGGIGRAIASHPGIDKIVFTGSTPTGRNIMSNAATTLKRLTLELGGNDAAIVLPDADIDAIAPVIFAKSFGNSGQTCAALKRLYVHESLHDALAEKIAGLARAAKVGPATDPASQFGPLQNKAQFDLVRALADDAKANGGRFLAGGEASGDAGYFFPLTVVTEVTDGMRIVDEEQFGPILPIVRYSDVDDAIARANASENGLGGSIWSSDLTRAEELARRLECGTAWVNDHSSISPAAPFGGAKQSGIGVEFGHWGLEEHMQMQTVHITR